ncbi:hypothetical protein G6F60_015514 [Rhizopus arrhizus]|nr:hypothetical protein G6F60_015514 [Rhizopus arrhizus]
MPAPVSWSNITPARCMDVPVPGVPKAVPGCCLAYATRSLTLATFNAGPTSSTTVDAPSMLTPVKSLVRSNGIDG